MKLVVDCNVLISAGISNGACRFVIQHVLSNHDWLLSDEVWREYTEVAKREHLQKYQPVYAGVLSEIDHLAKRFTIAETVDNPLDPKDAMYLELALAGKADALITGNTKHFPSSFSGTRVITPRQFIDELAYRQ